MPRVKGGYVTRQRRKKVLKLAKGYFGSKHTLYKTAHEQVMRSLAYAYRDRKVRKRDFRKLWIQRINAACQLNGMKYSRFVNGLNRAGVEVNRKMLADLAVTDAAAFASLVEVAKKGLENEPVVKNTVVSTPSSKTSNDSKVDLESLKVADLKELAKSKGIVGYTTMKKAELIEALKSNIVHFLWTFSFIYSY